MTTGNHVLTGVIIATVAVEPILVIPLAFASHFALDSLPHFGYRGGGYGEAMKHKSVYVVEILGLVGLILLASTGVFGWNIATLAAVIAVSPDFEWPYRYIFYERKGLTPPASFLTKFHQKIQWCERPWGAYIEALFFVGGFLLLSSIL